MYIFNLNRLLLSLFLATLLQRSNYKFNTSGECKCLNMQNLQPSLKHHSRSFSRWPTFCTGLII